MTMMTRTAASKVLVLGCLWTFFGDVRYHWSVRVGLGLGLHPSYSVVPALFWEGGIWDPSPLVTYFTHGLDTFTSSPTVAIGDTRSQTFNSGRLSLFIAF